ncbi:DNA polymerase IV [Desulfosporosinus metallidurans]|uniref:DNA polymerase IV n=1 Tax=Desulfosporosinus metallidurans TaxID=1888891 RepID=A0A1Q8QJ11_9FIRM|nr:DNA polymerase IV [Desulfosporosinus metallidurans]OLN27329.1 DNA polymerase IV [Desulfosporosinus metallidurans]
MAKRYIFHIDANSAYLSWEAAYRLQHGDPLDLRTVPSVVGGDPTTRHGIVLTKSIPAKKFKIETGETLYSACQKCPDLVIVPPHYGLYRQCSDAMVEILRDYSPSVQRFSVDECFLDFSGMELLSDDPIKTAHEIKDRVKNELGFTVNIGISTNKLLAKMAGELKKPDMVHTIFPEEIPTKMWPLPIEELFMVGRATSKKLRSRGIQTIGDLAKFDLKILKLFLKSHGVLVWNYAKGIDYSPVRTGGTIEVKGMGNSTTIPFDVEDRTNAHLVLLSLVESVSSRLRQANVLARLISVSFRTNEFYGCSHQRKLFNPTDCTDELWEIACELFDEQWEEQPLRHMGLRVSELCQNDFFQTSLFGKDYDKRRKVDSAVDVIRSKYGSSAIFRSAFLNSGLHSMTGGVVENEDYPLMTSLL